MGGQQRRVAGFKREPGAGSAGHEAATDWQLSWRKLPIRRLI